MTLIRSATRWSCSSWMLRQLEPLPVLTVNFSCPVTSRFLPHLASTHLHYVHQTGWAALFQPWNNIPPSSIQHMVKSQIKQKQLNWPNPFTAALSREGDYLVSLCMNDKLQYLQQRRATPGRPRCWWSPLSPSCPTVPAALAASDLIRWRLLIKYWTPRTVNKLFGKQLLDAIEQTVRQNVWACSQFAIKAV